MKIVVDLQGAQTGSRTRGIGRYAKSFAKALIRNKSIDDEIIIILNGALKESLEEIRSQFYALLPSENIRVFDIPRPAAAFTKDNITRRKVALLLRESFLASLRPDIVLITSLFEGYGDDAVVSIGLDKKMPTAVIHHDLIPYVDKKNYLDKDTNYKQWYLENIEYLKKADLLLCNSDYSRKELIRLLNVDENKTFTIYAGIEPFFRPIELEKTQKLYLMNKFNIEKRFLIYVGGADKRKNLKGLIESYSHIKENYQLVIVGDEPTGNIEELKSIANSFGLTDKDVIFTGYVEDEELVRLYNIASLAVIPSFMEGFGFPALEAMSCGTPVASSNTTSLPEVLGRQDITFDPYNIDSMSSKIIELLENETLRDDVVKYGLERAKIFSWDKTAKLALEQLRRFENKINILSKPRLAYLSPLPPDKTGIAYYSLELLPYLGKYYEIDCILPKANKYNLNIDGVNLRDFDFFLDKYKTYDRILYHVGNNHIYHSHMIKTLDKIPGVVVLHDFYLGHLISYFELVDQEQNGWTDRLYYAHGYKAVSERFKDIEKAKFEYPCNLEVFENALGVIVHSKFSKELAKAYYDIKDIKVIPHIRKIQSLSDVKKTDLGFKEDDFLICSFGFLAPTKLNHVLLEAFNKSYLKNIKNVKLIFAGEEDSKEYGDFIKNKIKEYNLEDQVSITGFLKEDVFKKYLSACDMAVQLRTLSRGETSGTVSDCMAYGKPIICNANGSFAEFSKDAVYMLDDDFKIEDLTKALETLYEDENLRRNLGQKAREYIKEFHNPELCAKLYFEYIEEFYKRPFFCLKDTISSIKDIENISEDKKLLLDTSKSIAVSIKSQNTLKQMFVDISPIVEFDLRTGIERVTRSILKELLENQPKGYRVEPVYSKMHIDKYYYAREFVSDILDIPKGILKDEVIDFKSEDIYIGLDLHQHLIIKQQHYLKTLKDFGVKIYFVVYDLLPIRFPKYFVGDIDNVHKEWLKAIYNFDGAVCISKAVADELYDFYKIQKLKRYRPFKIGYFHLGSDIKSSLPTTGMPEDANKVLELLKSRITFLMVGTIEPRKGYLQTLRAFEELWKKGFDINLVIVGQEGWKAVEESKRRTIPTIINSIKTNPELNKRLFWLEGISDEYLEHIYNSSSALIMASEGEGFGLPLIEASYYKLPIIARDIPVFKEIAKEHAYYFKNSLDPKDLKDALIDWIELYKKGIHPKSDNMPYLTWEESTKALLDVILEDKWEYII